jgi:aconitate hydratase
MFRKRYANVSEGDEEWRELETASGQTYTWGADSTYVRHPTFFEDGGVTGFADVIGARPLAILGDSVTTDHISPAGSIKKDSPAGAYLIEHGVEPRDFNSYGSRRGNHEVMMRGTFANIRIRNQMAPGTEGGVTKHMPDGELMSIYDAAMSYQAEGVPLVVIAGTETGRPRAPGCSASRRRSSRASSAFTAPTWSGWACCRCSSRRAPTARP